MRLGSRWCLSPCLLDRRRVLAVAAAALLVLHLWTPEPWPIALREADIPWDLRPEIPNIVPAPMLSLQRLEGARLVTLDLSVGTNLALFLGLGFCAFLTVWAGCRCAERNRRPGPLRAGLVLGLSGLAVLGALGTGAVGADSRHCFYPAFRDFYPGWMNLEGRSGPTGARIAYAGTNIPYYLLGAGLRNQVQYVNIDGHREWLLHDYHRAALERGEPNWPNSRPGWDRAEPDYQAWLGNLEAAGIQLLVVTRVNPAEGPHNVADAESFPIERSWAEGHPESFEPLYGVKEGDPFFRLYRLRRGR